jgi:hypothetical protein
VGDREALGLDREEVVLEPQAEAVTTSSRVRQAALGFTVSAF